MGLGPLLGSINLAAALALLLTLRLHPRDWDSRLVAHGSYFCFSLNKYLNVFATLVVNHFDDFPVGATANLLH